MNTKYIAFYDVKEYRYAFGVNLWRGNVWGIRKDNGKRQRLKSVYN